MTLLYAAILLCYALMPLSLISGQWLLFPALAVIVLLLRRLSILEQQVSYLLQQDAMHRFTAVMQKRDKDIGLPQVKGL